MIGSWFERIALEKERFAQKNSMFSPCFWQLKEIHKLDSCCKDRLIICYKDREWFTVFPLFMPKSESLFTKEQPWVNRSRHSLQKSNHERVAQVAQVAHDKRDGNDLLIFMSESLFRLQKPRAICSKNRWANSQSCIYIKNFENLVITCFLEEITQKTCIP